MDKLFYEKVRDLVPGLETADAIEVTARWGEKVEQRKAGDLWLGKQKPDRPRPEAKKASASKKAGG